MGSPAVIAGIRFLNARPLVAGLDAGIPARFSYRYHAADPAACGRQLAEATVDAALVSVASLPELPGARVLPDLGIACRAATTSVLLISRVPLARIRRLAAHAASRSSVVLARLLLAERWRAHPEVVEAGPPLESMLEGHDAAVIIGDPALEVRGRSGYEEVDLASAWIEWTGTPFVFAAWALGTEAPDGMEDLLRASRSYADSNWDELVPRWARLHRLSEDATHRYLERSLSFTLGSEERAGMTLFLERAAAASLLAPCSPVWSE